METEQDWEIEKKYFHCEMCSMINKPTYADMRYFSKSDEEWVYLCEDCWNSWNNG